MNFSFTFLLLMLSRLGSIGSADVSSKEELEKVVTNWASAFTEYHKNPKLLEDHMAQDAVGCFEDMCQPYHDTYEAFFVTKPTVFEARFEVLSHTHDQLLTKWYHYLEYDGGCTSMFYDHAIFTIENGMVVKTESFLNTEEFSLMARCMDNLDEPDDNIEGVPPKDSMIKTLNGWIDKFKKYPQNPNIIDQFVTNDAVACMGGRDCSPLHDVYGQIFAKKPKTFDYVTQIHTITQTQIVLRCWDYVEYDDGCSSIFMVDTVLNFDKDGKITKTNTMFNEEQHALFARCSLTASTTVEEEDK